MWVFVDVEGLTIFDSWQILSSSPLCLLCFLRFCSVANLTSQTVESLYENFMLFMSVLCTRRNELEAIHR